MTDNIKEICQLDESDKNDIRRLMEACYHMVIKVERVNIQEMADEFKEYTGITVDEMEYMYWYVGRVEETRNKNEGPRLDIGTCREVILEELAERVILQCIKEQVNCEMYSRVQRQWEDYETESVINTLQSRFNRYGGVIKEGTIKRWKLLM